MAGRAKKAATAPQQLDLFFTPLKDIRFRDEQETMVFPFFALGKDKRTEPIEFRHPKTGEYVKVTAPEDCGIATIYDGDLIVWGMSSLREIKDRGLPTGNTLDFAPYDFYHSVRTGWEVIGGHDYDRLEDTIRRLTGTQIETNLRVEGKKKQTFFHWLEYAEIFRDPKTDRIEKVRIQFPKWLIDGYLNDQLVLTIDDEYFSLKGGLERWLYRFVRKSVGTKTRWVNFRMETLHQRSGSAREFKKFAFDVRKLIDGYDPDSKRNSGKPRTEVPTFPRYRLKHLKIDGVEFVAARCIETVQPIAHIRPGERDHRYKAGFLALSDDTRDEARAMCKASGTDEGALYEAWKASNQQRLTDRSAEPLKAPGRAYLGYVRKALQRLKKVG